MANRDIVAKEKNGNKIYQFQALKPIIQHFGDCEVNFGEYILEKTWIE